MGNKVTEISWDNSHLKVPNIRKFDASLNKAFNKYMLPVFESQKEEASIAYMNRILKLDGPTSLNTSSTPERKLLAEISVGAFEIFNAYESLLDTEFYIRKFPYTGTRISKSRYLKSVIGNHLNNNYILKERMVRYLKILRKRYGKQAASNGELTRKITEILRRLTEEYFSGLNSVRNIHVHVEEFYDPALERLSLLESFIHHNLSLPSIEHFKAYYETQYNMIRKDKIQEIKSINSDIKKILDAFFDQIYTIVFDENDNFIVSILE